MSANAVPAVILPRKLRLPRDASIQYTDYPPQLYLNMTITKVEKLGLQDDIFVFVRDDIFSPLSDGQLFAYADQLIGEVKPLIEKM